MLAEIRIRDLALLEEVSFTLAPGLNVVSGETGEGKSLLFTAIALLLGARGRKGLVRTGRPRAEIEGRFVLDAAQRARLDGVTDLLDGEPAGEPLEICLRRVIQGDGQSRAYLNGSLCPVGLLGRIGSRLVDVHGQAANQSLLRPGEQRAVLDQAGKIGELAARYRVLFAELRDLDARRAAWDAGEAERQERLEFLRFQARELEDLGPRAGEEDELEAELRRLAAASVLNAIFVRGAEALVEGDHALGALCARTARELKEIVPDDAEVAEIVARLESLGIEAEDLGAACSGLADTIRSDPARLAAVEERLSAIRMQGQRHRCDGDGLVARLAGLREEIDALGGDGGGRAALERRDAELTAELRALGARILKQRRRTARGLHERVHEALKELRMGAARIRIEVGPKALAEDFDPRTGTEWGPAAVHFLVASNPGESEQPLERIASGGETARIMLALKDALAGAHKIPLLIFDEIDAGIGGRVGTPFGRRIARIAAHHQVLLITHLPQVAAFADRHVRVRKTVTRGRTRTHVEVLEGEERVQELADMLGASAGSAPAAAQQAAALLEEAAS